MIKQRGSNGNRIIVILNLVSLDTGIQIDRYVIHPSCIKNGFGNDQTKDSKQEKHYDFTVRNASMETGIQGEIG